MSAQQAINSLRSQIASAQTSDDLISDVDRLMLGTISWASEQAITQDNICLTAAKYHLAAGGHKIRARLSLEAGLALGMQLQDNLIIAAVCELLHNASLIHDDIQDGDTIRRNVETVWKKFGVNVALCTGDFLLSAAYGVLANFSNAQLIPKLIATIHQRTSTVIQGQCADIAYQNQQLCSISSYQKIAISKSGALLSLPIELALMASQRLESIADVRAAAESFAIAYQIADDLVDIDKDASCHSLNIVFVLKAAGERENPIQVAQSLALHHLKEATNLATKLPHHSGALLIELAEQLKQKLSN
jgi:geranylgeranyl pyrophosphate synthase